MRQVYNRVFGIHRDGYKRERTMADWHAHEWRHKLSRDLVAVTWLGDARPQQHAPISPRSTRSSNGRNAWRHTSRDAWQCGIVPSCLALQFAHPAFYNRRALSLQAFARGMGIVASIHSTQWRVMRYVAAVDMPHIAVSQINDFRASKISSVFDWQSLWHEQETALADRPADAIPHCCKILVSYFSALWRLTMTVWQTLLRQCRWNAANKSRVQHYLQLAMIESSVLVGSDQVGSGSGHRSKV